MAKKINSRRKGAEGELEFAKLCQENGYDGARRGQQYSGIEGQDVVGLEGFHVEVKRVEALNVDKALEQSKRDAADGAIPIVAHRKNRRPWLITMDADHFFQILNQKEG